MGNAKSISSNNSKLANEIDRIASNYILSQTFDDMNKLSEKDHCDKLVLLTAKIINKNLNPLEQKEVVKRIDGGIPAAAQATAPLDAAAPTDPLDVPPIKDDAAVDAKPIKEDAAVDAKPIKDDAAPLDVKVGGADTSASEADTSEADTREADTSEADTKEADRKEADTSEADRKADCIKIAKFYVKIAHLYAAIMKTINPVIISKDENGKTKKYDLMNKQNMPDDAEIKSIQHNNFCTTRLNALMQEGDINKNNPKNPMLTISPRFCSINYDLKTKKTRKFYEGEKGSTSSSDIKPSYGGDKKNKDSEDDDDEDDEDTNKKVKKDKDKDKEKEKDKNGKKKSKDSEDDDDEDDEDEKRKRKTKKKDKDDEDDEDKDKSKNKEKKEKKEKDVVVNEPINVKETPMPMDSTEVGIPELMKLYYDVYDDKKGAFISMSPEAKISYQADVDAFYMAFTGKEIETDENGDKKITKFEQIPLREFHKTDGCKPDGIYTTSYEGSLKKEFGKENLFEKYANHVNKMMNSMNANQNNLFGILKKLFKFQKHKEPEKKEEKVEEKEKKVEKKEEKVEEKEKEKDTAITKDTGKDAVAAPMPVVFQGPGQAQAQAQGQAAPIAPIAPTVIDPTKAVPIEPAPIGPAEVPVVAEPVIKPPATVAEPVKEDVKLQTPLPDEKVGGDNKDERQSPLDAIINPDLDGELLQTLIDSARKLIVNLYISCETDFLEGLHIFEAIVATQLGKTTNSQIKYLDELTLEYLGNL